VVILYETDEVLSRATSLCDRIMEEHWNDVDIHVDHWPFEKLVASDTAFAAAAKAALADILVVTTASEGGFSPEFLEWTELLLGARKNREGALVGLFAPGTAAVAHDTQLHRLALRAGMDYLNRLPTSPPQCLPDQTDWCASRAKTFTGTLDAIMRDKPNAAAH
jgi:hypothetical protein